MATAAPPGRSRDKKESRSRSNGRRVEPGQAPAALASGPLDTATFKRLVLDQFAAMRAETSALTRLCLAAKTSAENAAALASGVAA